MGHYDEQYEGAANKQRQRLRESKTPIVEQFEKAVRDLDRLRSCEEHRIAREHADTALLWLKVQDF